MKHSSKEKKLPAFFILNGKTTKPQIGSHGGKIQMRWKTFPCQDLPLSNDTLQCKLFYWGKPNIKNFIFDQFGVSYFYRMGNKNTINKLKSSKKPWQSSKDIIINLFYQ